MNSKVADVLDSIVNEKGYKIGAPWRWDDKALGIVVPVTITKAAPRKYKTNHEVDCVDVKDTGNISVLKVRNNGDVHVFFRTGSVFGGATQERGLQRSTMVAPDSEASVGVRCVHATKGISPGAGMRDEKVIAPMSVTRNLIYGDQSAVWSSVQTFCSGDGDVVDRPRRCGSGYGAGSGPMIYGFSSSPTISSYTLCNNSAVSGNDDLLGNLKGADTGKMDEMLKKVPHTEMQVGAFLFDHRGVLGFEMFDSPDSWKAVKDAIISRFGNEVSDAEADIPFTLDEKTVRKLIKKFVEDMLKAQEESPLESGGSRTVTLASKGFVGEYTVLSGWRGLEDDMIHILVSRSE